MTVTTLPPLTVVRAVFVAAEPQRVPRFLGTAVHGALGHALRRSVCAFPERVACPGCALVARCAYPALFDTPAPPDPVLQAHGIRDKAPRPLVLAPDADWADGDGPTRALAPGDAVGLRVTLVGNAAADLPLVAIALDRAARAGLGLAEGNAPAGRPRRASMSLDRIETADGRPLGRAGETAVPAPEPLDRPADAVPGAAVLRFVTPLRLTVEGHVTSAPTAVPLVRALARRANAFARLDRTATDDAVDEAAASDAAGALSADASALRRVLVRRWSSRQRRRLELPGLVGPLRVRGDALGPLWPLLRWGALAQVGKGTSMGFGRYELGPDPDNG